MKHEPIDDHAERKRISVLIDRCEKEQMTSDLIKRSDAIGACAYETIECYEARKAIRALPSVDRTQVEWIPCGERMPEYRKTVLISTFWGVKTGFLDSTEAYGDFWEIIEDDATAALHNIYAWMPLPKPWKGVDDENSSR